MGDLKHLTIENYLRTSLNTLKSGKYDVLHLVLGNESCDLDSAISSLVYAMYLHCVYISSQGAKSVDNITNVFLPIFNVKREDYELKTEVVYYLNQFGINYNHLIFRDDLDLLNIVNSKKVEITLVDHHILSENDNFLSPYVVNIIDHRPIDKEKWYYNERVQNTIEVVGSCCTLIADEIKKQNVTFDNVRFFQVLPVCADLLHSTIILDTLNFSKDLNKGTRLDSEMVEFLETIIKPEDVVAERNRKLSCLLAAKSDVSSLSSLQLLKKDLKVFGDILVPSFPILVKEFMEKPNVEEALKDVLTKRNGNIAVLLGMDVKAGMKRDVGIYATDIDDASRMSTLLEDWTSPSFQLNTQPTTPYPLYNYYEQKNYTATRKQYIPAINSFLNKTNISP